MKFRFGLIALFSATLLITACGDKETSTNSNVPTASASEGSVISDFYKAIEAGKTDDALKAIAPLPSNATEAQSNEFKNKADLVITHEKAKIEAKGGIKAIDVSKIGDAAVNNDQTPFSVKITFGDGSTQEGKVNLVKDGSNWKISL